MLPRTKSTRRSECPVSLSLERFGDRWSLLIIRDMMVRGFRRFSEFQHSGEGIATNILAGRLQNLEAAGIIRADANAENQRRKTYRLTQKGVDLAPVVLELLIWGAHHEGTGRACATVEKLAANRGAIVSEVRRRWQNHDSTPLQSKQGEWHWS